ncbi:MAG: helix-turn-helix domain-containing protein [bacterium]|nr:helix-turn-helix domain-containing protein [bacterium]
MDAAVHTTYIAALAVMLVVNAVLALRSRSTLPLLYSGALIAVAAIVLLSTPAPADRHVIAFNSDSIDSRRRLIGLAGSCAAICAVLFWDRLLLLKIHAPRGRYGVFAVGGVIALIGGLMFVPGIPSTWLEAAQQFASLALLPTMAWTAGVTLRAGFRPAIYSTIGVLFFVAMASVYVAQNREWLELAPQIFSGQLLAVGFLGEFVCFVLSLAGRATALGNPDSAAAESEGIRTYRTQLDTRRKYERSTLNHVNTERLQQRLDLLMREERIYCDEDLSLDRLAELCEISRHELSEYLNHRLGQNFNRFINDYRVHEVQERLRTEPERSLLDIAYSAGFNSKTRFNTEFKRVTGKTPGDYRRQSG